MIKKKIWRKKRRGGVAGYCRGGWKKWMGVEEKGKNAINYCELMKEFFFKCQFANEWNLFMDLKGFNLNLGVFTNSSGNLKKSMHY